MRFFMFDFENKIALQLSALASEITCHNKNNTDRLGGWVSDCKRKYDSITFSIICSLAILKSKDIGALSIINTLGGRNVMPSDDITYFCKLFRMKNDISALSQFRNIVESAIDNTESALFLSQCAYYSIDRGINKDNDTKRFISIIYNLSQKQQG